MTPRLRWTSKSLVKLSDELTEQGHEASPTMVRRLMYQAGWRLQSNNKSMAKSLPHPDRNAQFGYISEQAAEFAEAGQPVVSVDTKKKELVGNFANGGREWARAGEAPRVLDHDFPGWAEGKAIPYGVYDLEGNEGFLSVGDDHDTPAFAAGVWRRLSRPTYGSPMPSPGRAISATASSLPAATWSCWPTTRVTGHCRSGSGATRVAARWPSSWAGTPRNLDFTAGPAGWLFGGSFDMHASRSHWQDYSCTVEHGIVAIAAAVAEPAGFALLRQAMFGDDYRGAAVTFRGELRSTDAPRRTGLFLRVNTDPRRDIRGPLTEAAALADPDNTIVTVSAGRDWTRHEVTTRVPGDCDIVAFGIFMAGHGRIELRRAELIRGS